MLLSKLGRLPRISTGLSRHLARGGLSSQPAQCYTTTQTNEKVIKRHTLKDQIVQKIKIGGPISIRDYMKIVLTAPNSVSAINSKNLQ